MNWKLSILAVVVLLSACSTSRDVVQDGPFQKRKYVNKGWFLDLPSAHRMEPKKHVVEQAEARQTEMNAQTITEPADASGTVSIQPVEADLAQAPAENNGAPPAIAPVEKDEATAATADLSTPTDNGYGMRASLAKRVGAATEAVPALMAPRGDNVGGINIFALLGFIFAFIFPIAGLVLSLIGMHQTSPGDGQGHGLAVAGLIISIVFIVIFFAVIV